MEGTIQVGDIIRISLSDLYAKVVRIDGSGTDKSYWGFYSHSVDKARKGKGEDETTTLCHAGSVILVEKGSLKSMMGDRI